jgi:hypothetical protein
VVSSLRPGTRASNSSMVAEQLSSLVIRASNQPKKIQKIMMLIVKEKTKKLLVMLKEENNLLINLKLDRCTRGGIYVFLGTIR